MKNGIYFILYFVLILEINSNFLRFLDETNPFDYSTIKANVTNKNLEGGQYTATNSDQSIAYITDSNILINGSRLYKSGASSNLNNSEFYGVNSAILVNGGNANVDRSTIITSSEGSNGVTCTNKGSIRLSRSHINNNSSFSRGLLSTYGGSIIANNISISTSGRSSACLANDKGEGSISCTYCIFLTNGVGSPFIDSTGDIKVYCWFGTSHNSQIAVIEGKNSISITGDSNVRASGNGGMNDSCAVLIYQSQPGDPNVDRSTFNCEESYLSIMPNSSVYSTAPFFYVTNTKTNITINRCRMSFDF